MLVLISSSLMIPIQILPLNRPHSIDKNSNTSPRLSGHFSIFGFGFLFAQVSSGDFNISNVGCWTWVKAYISGLSFGKEVFVVFPKISTNPKISKINDCISHYIIKNLRLI